MVVVTVRTVFKTQPSTLFARRMCTQAVVPTVCVSGKTWTMLPLIRVATTVPAAGSVRTKAPPPAEEVITA
jgi:hypothetical protein